MCNGRGRRQNRRSERGEARQREGVAKKEGKGLVAGADEEVSKGQAEEECEETSRGSGGGEVHGTRGAKGLRRRDRKGVHAKGIDARQGVGIGQGVSEEVDKG